MRRMTAWYLRCLGLVMSLALAAVVVLPVRLLGDPAISGTSTAQARQQRLVESYGKLPLSFELNQGQTDSRVRFLSRGRGYSLFLTGNEAVLMLRKINPQSKLESAQARYRLPIGQLQPAAFKAESSGQRQRGTAPAVVRMRLVGANGAAKITGLEQLPGRSNYIIGNDPKKWRTNVPNYAKVKYANVYPGVDLVYYGNQRQLEYDFVLKPGADPGQIALSFAGAKRLRLAADGDLIISIGAGELVEHKPVIYQDRGGRRRPVAGGYVLKNSHAVGFKLAAYDNQRSLTIDPSLVYSTYLGGRRNDEGLGIAVDSAGNAYVTGSAGSPDFPVTPGAFQTTFAGVADVFVSKLNPSGSALVYSTYLSDAGGGNGIAVDSAGNAYVTGLTQSPDFPVTPGAFQTTLASRNGDAFVSKLNPSGSALVYSTYLGGSNSDQGNGIAVDSAGNAYVTGITESSDFPVTPGAFQTILASGGFYDVFISKLNPSGSALVYSTYLGGSNSDQGNGIAVDSAGNAYVTGLTQSPDFPVTPGAFQPTLAGPDDVFVSKLNPSGSALVYSTYLGGGSYDVGLGIALDSAGNAYVTGGTYSRDFPVTPGAFQPTLAGGADVFMSKLNPSGSALVYSTYLGGSNYDWGDGIALDSAGNAYVTGYTQSPDFPVTPGAFQTTFAGSDDVFVSKLNPSGSALVYSTYLGGGIDVGNGIALDSAGNAYVTGYTRSSNFPVTPGAFQTTFAGGFEDAFVSKFHFAGLAFSSFGGSLRIDPDAGVFFLKGSFTLGSGGSINPLTQQVSFSVGNYSVTVPAGSFFKVSNGYVYQKKVNDIFLCLYIIKNKNMPGSYSLLANSGHGALTGATTSPVPVTLTIGDDSGSTQMKAKFD